MNVEKKIRIGLLALYAFSLPFEMFYSSTVFVALALIGLIEAVRGKWRNIPRNVWVFQGVFLLGLTGYFLSIDRHSASFFMERQLTIFLLPLLLPMLVQADQRTAVRIAGALCAGTTVAVLYLFLILAYNIHFNYELPLSSAFTGRFFNHAFSNPLNIHAGYLSIYVVFSFVYIIRIGFSNDKAWILAGSLVIAFILAAGLFFLAARNAFLTCGLLCLFVVPFYLRRRRLYLAIALSGLVVSVAILFRFDYLRERFSVYLLNEISPTVQHQQIDIDLLEPRWARWQCAMQLIEKAPLFGYGTGDEIGMLKSCYVNRGLYISYLEDFNAHNNYLSILIKHGWVGLCLFLACFAYYAWLAFKARDLLYVAFLLLLLIGFYTENILDANKGIVFFALFNTLLGYKAIAEGAQKDPGVAHAAASQ